jgi:putative hemolysin
MIEIIILLVLIFANGIFSGTELAVVSARRGRLQQRAEEGDVGAAAAIKLQEDPNRFLSSVQIGITLIGTLTGVFGGASIANTLEVPLRSIPLLAPYAPSIALTTVVLIITYLTLVLGELVPKRLALQNAERIAGAMARPMTLIARISSPVIWLLSFSTQLVLRLLGQGAVAEERVTEEDIRQMVREGAEGGEVEPHEQQIIERLFLATDRAVRHIMTPRRDVYMLEAEATLGQVMPDLIESGFSRFPVYEKEPDKIVGMVHVRDMLKLLQTDGRDVTVRNAMSPPLYVPENSQAMALLPIFRKSQRHMAIVVGELGGIEGVVTLEDVLEEIVGEIPDEYDELDDPSIVRREDGSLLVDGVLPIDEVRTLLKVEELPGEQTYRFDTLAGFVISLIGHIPTVGEYVEWQHWKFEVVDMDGLRVDKVLIQREEPAAV